MTAQQAAKLAEVARNVLADGESGELLGLEIRPRADGTTDWYVQSGSVDGGGEEHEGVVVVNADGNIVDVYDEH